jgi:hypothetical protein
VYQNVKFGDPFVVPFFGSKFVGITEINRQLDSVETHDGHVHRKRAEGDGHDQITFKLLEFLLRFFAPGSLARQPETKSLFPSVCLSVCFVLLCFVL